MRNFLVILALATVFAFSSNAQSKDCCSKEKGETTKLEKCNQEKVTMKSGGDKVETTTTSALSNGKETVEKEVVVTKTKMDKKDKCGDNSSCCDKMNKEKKVEKEVEKKLENK
ncbi:MAG: hypothetical protein ABI638_00845 [Ignavibacteriota bacterium]